MPEGLGVAAGTARKILPIAVVVLEVRKCLRNELFVGFFDRPGDSKACNAQQFPAAFCGPQDVAIL